MTFQKFHHARRAHEQSLCWLHHPCVGCQSIYLRAIIEHKCIENSETLHTQNIGCQNTYTYHVIENDVLRILNPHTWSTAPLTSANEKLYPAPSPAYIMRSSFILITRRPKLHVCVVCECGVCVCVCVCVVCVDCVFLRPCVCVCIPAAYSTRQGNVSESF